MAGFRFRQRRTRRWWYSVLTVVAAAAFSVVFVSASSANLSGSTFEGNDGNLAVSTAGNTDWANVAGLHAAADFASGTGDNSFGGGTKEDGAAVNVVSGSIPPNKSDLTRFYEASEVKTVGGAPHAFLYLAWERTNVLGNANMDFEIEQNGSTSCPGTTDCTLSRTSGDILVTYDFGGSGTPTIGIQTWNGTQWNPDSTVVAESAVNSTTVADPVTSGVINTADGTTDNGLPCPGGSCPANTFGEAAIDLTASGFSSSDLCKFGKATTFLKSRASSSFTSEVKDFIAPVATPIANLCGTVKIIKATDPAGINQDFTYTSTVPGLTSGFTLNAGSSNTSVTESNVPPGSYTVTEGAEPNGFSLESLTCQANAGSSGTQHAGTPAQADISIGTNGSVTCTYTNKENPGAIKITKTTTKGGGGGVAGAVFSITDSNGNPVAGSPATTLAGGSVCVGNLPFGTYSVKETSAPTGYANDNGTATSVSVTKSSTCGDGNEATYSVKDNPLTDIGATAASEISGSNGTQSTITCKDGNGNTVASGGPAGSASASKTGLEPGTYTCTIVIDP